MFTTLPREIQFSKVPSPMTTHSGPTPILQRGKTQTNQNPGIAYTASPAKLYQRGVGESTVASTRSLLVSCGLLCVGE